jgi:hypothetical protein
MANVKDMQQEALASIDTAKAVVDNLFEILKSIEVTPVSLDMLANEAIQYVLQILRHLGLTQMELKVWLTDFLIYVMPALELSVKAILLSNLKSMTSCSIDPRIPDKYRKKHNNTSEEYGIDINISAIDFLNKLGTNPLSDMGKTMYFGLKGVEDVYKFARADDFDSFLWFAKNKGKFPNSAVVSGLSEGIMNDNIHGNNATSVDGKSLFETVTVTFSNEDKPSSILVGNTFTEEGNKNIISMCIDKKYDGNNNIVENTLVPVSDDGKSVNWYARKIVSVASNDNQEWGENRDFSKENPICNIQYIENAAKNTPISDLINDKFRFSILPKPIVHIPNLLGGESATSFVKLLFDADGTYNPNGKYTLNANADNLSNMSYLDGAITVNNGSVTVHNKDKVANSLIECYKGLTVYEFNFDYIMSLKLFDAKVLVSLLLDYTMNLGIGQSHQEGRETMKEIVKNIISVDDTELYDCFYTFDNTRYDALLRRTEEKRAKRHDESAIDEILSILNEYNETSELHEQIDILQRTITQASVTISEGTDDVDKVNFEFNFVIGLIENLLSAIMSALFTPKVLMVLMVNQEIMGNVGETFSIKDLMRTMKSIIISIIQEVKDLILQELIKLALKYLEPIVGSMTTILTAEQLQNYTSAIQDIINNYPILWFQLGNKYVDTKLDTVDYADIDTTYDVERDTPKTNNC